MTDHAAVLRALLRQDLPSFIAKCFTTLEAGRPFQNNWHIQHIGWQLGRVAQGEVKRLAITIPPRHLKSICVTVAYTAWAMGHNPSLKVMTVSYADELANSMPHRSAPSSKAPGSGHCSLPSRSVGRPRRRL